MNKTSHPILSMVVSRVGLGLLSLLIVSLVIFFSVSLLPGSYASAILGQNATPELLAPHRHWRPCGFSRMCPTSPP